MPEAQPSLIYADSDVIAFSADYATNVADDPFAVFHDPDAPNGQVTAPAGALLDPQRRPRQRPDTVYEVAPGVRSPAEILIFFVAADTSTARTDDYVLYRQGERRHAGGVARNLLRVGARSVLLVRAHRRGRRRRQASASRARQPRARSTTRPRSTSRAADTGRSALADSVRAVRVRLGRHQRPRPGDEESTCELSRLIPLPNAGFGDAVHLRLAAPPRASGSRRPPDHSRRWRAGS